MKFFNRGLAIFMAALMLFPSSPPMMANASPLDSAGMTISGATTEEELLQEGTKKKLEESQALETKKSKETEESGKENGSLNAMESVKEDVSKKTEESETAESEAFGETKESADDKTTKETEESSSEEMALETEEYVEKSTAAISREDFSEEDEPLKDADSGDDNGSGTEDADAGSRPAVQESASITGSIVKKAADLIKAANKVEKLEDAYDQATPGNAERGSEDKAEDEVGFNTGNHVWHVVSRKDFDKGLGDAFFEADGSYRINIPEENPFFPYEVQFTYDGQTFDKWFMTPKDKVTVGEHEFSVSAHFDNTVLTQMSLQVAGKIVVVYPQKKEFTDGDGAMAASLLPLEEQHLEEVDLTGRTPVELTQVSVRYIFGEDVLKDTDKVIWTNEGKDDYRISQSGDVIDLSYDTSWGNSSWEMIVGEADQLNMDNIRYIVPVKTTASEEWLVPTIYKQDEDGKRTKVSASDISYYDSYSRDDNRRLSFDVSSDELDWEIDPYLSLAVNESLFANVNYSALKVFKGKTADANAEITEQIMAKDMTAKDSGYLLSSDSWITIAAYDGQGREIGRLPLEVDFYRQSDHVSIDYQMYGYDGEQWKQVSNRRNYDGYDENYTQKYTYYLNDEYPLNKECYLRATYYSKGSKADPSPVTAAYAGRYSSIKQAESAGAVNIKGSLFDDKDGGGYKADYSSGVYFTIFTGADDSGNQMVNRYFVKTGREEPTLSNTTSIYFYGVNDGQGNTITSYVVNTREDAYGDYSYITILVEEDADLTNLAPIYSTPQGINLYTEGKLEESGKSYHDFSKGPVQYTAGSESKKEQQNYWLQVISKTSGNGELYINSLKDPQSKTQNKDGVIYSTREMIIDGHYDYQHDILLINRGTGDIPSLKAELVSDQVELDPYWTLTGNQKLLGFDSVIKSTSHGELQNFAKLRIKPKDGMERGNISGTLTISSAGQVLMVLNLTGTIGDPCITTTEIPDAVKYVPYAVMIQNSNKYSFNKVTYYLDGGTLPKGMRLYSNGELYGVPTESGTFTFNVRMDNSGNFKSSVQPLTLTVKENTNTNVYNESDEGYSIKQHLGTEAGSGTRDYVLTSTNDQLYVSNGEYGEFIDLWLNGEKLVEGVDYTKESGSTRMTIKSQTFTKKAQKGLNTIAAEFREGGDRNRDLKRTAQNFRIGGTSSSGATSGGTTSSGSSGGGGRRSRSGSSSSGSSTTYSSKKGYVHSQNGIITGTGSGYSNWQQDEKGWKLIYADKTTAAGTMITLEDGRNVEQILWEKINGAWYAFGADGYIKSGWVYDYQLNGWYNVSIEKGMQSGWYTDDQDKHTYYLEQKAGNLATGWKSIDNKWFYFNAVSTTPTWELDETTGDWRYNMRSKSKPFGAMYKGEVTPDGYHVNDDGAWDGKEK